mmetsp:Transcript_6034/g.15804  ORF Transcript_6034/g.15804 Transcript_6034/m.15804 type:complete len:659 (+) Transcript_6034:716-2692(+)|eukprot:jgi/Tetstr1/458213/TSEL_044701.t1
MWAVSANARAGSPAVACSSRGARPGAPILGASALHCRSASSQHASCSGAHSSGQRAALIGGAGRDGLCRALQASLTGAEHRSWFCEGRRQPWRRSLVAELGSSRPSSSDHNSGRGSATATEAVATRRIDELQRLGSPERGPSSGSQRASSSEVASSASEDYETREAASPEWASGTCTESAEDSEDRRLANPNTRNGVPVFVMLPLDTVWVIEKDGEMVSQLKRESSLDKGLETLRKAGVEGVMVDVWWGLTERSPQEYDFTAYEKLFDKVHSKGLKLQAVMSFHAAGGNVGDTCQIPLPDWVMEIGEANPDIWYTDLNGNRNMECLSLGCDECQIFQGRSPIEMYHDFISAFADHFQHLFGDCVTEITVGMGPAGELRYPSYPEGDGRWRFPGVGEFQCYDQYMLDDLKIAADKMGKPEWGLGGPHDAGCYNSKAWETGFFNSDTGSWSSPYGAFFLGWYSGLLLRHADRVLGAAAAAMNRPGMKRVHGATRISPDGHLVYEFHPACCLGAKLAGVHWWYKSASHAAELTAGYYNTRDRCGYADFVGMAKRHACRLHFTCVEMRDCEHTHDGRCSPEGLLQQVIEAASLMDVPLAGENALQRYDYHAFQRITHSAFGQSASAGSLVQVTFLRMGDLMFDNWSAFMQFLRSMKGDSMMT